jgi:acyl-CoA thioester hydrolase
MGDNLFRFSTALEVRRRDVDALGHVNNAVYFTYLEQACVHYLHALGFLPENPGDIGLIIAKANCRYKAPLRLGERVTIWLRVSALHRSSFDFEYRMEGDDGRLVATARTVQVCYYYEGGQPMPLPDRWREAILAYEPGL